MGVWCPTRHSILSFPFLTQSRRMSGLSKTILTKSFVPRHSNLVVDLPLRPFHFHCLEGFEKRCGDRLTNVVARHDRRRSCPSSLPFPCGQTKKTRSLPLPGLVRWSARFSISSGISSASALHFNLQLRVFFRSAKVHAVPVGADGGRPEVALDLLFPFFFAPLERVALRFVEADFDVERRRAPRSIRRSPTSLCAWSFSSPRRRAWYSSGTCSICLDTPQSYLHEGLCRIGRSSGRKRTTLHLSR